jgi:hypothetical protein
MTEEKSGVVQIHGLEYQTVALRVTQFREQHPDWTIQTKILGNGQYVTVKATIRNETGRVISTGHAEEERGEGMINTTSVVENCETSAVGRALAFHNYPGQFLRSADEMHEALIQQGIKKVQKDYGERMKIIRDILPQIMDIKDRLADNDYHAAAEIVLELTEEQLYALNLAPTKGGVLTTAEVNQLKSNEYAEARNSITGFDGRK